MTFEPNTAWLPLLLATLLLVVSAIIAWRWPRRLHWLYVGWRIAIFVALTALARWQLGSPLHPRYAANYSDLGFWEHVIEAGWWLFAASMGVTLVRLLVVLEHRPRETQIVSDLLAGAIYITTLLAIVNFVFGVPIAGLLATSGVVAIVFGLALQNTLADVFSGIAVGIERPYKAGDLLWVEGDIEGHVTQVTWRSTHIATFQSNIAIVPNSVIAKARLINRSLPEPMRRDTIVLKLDATATPEHCIATLIAASRASLLPLASGVPTASCVGLQGDGASYEVNYLVTWFPTYLVMAHHLSIRSMSIATVLPWSLGFLGLALGGWITDRVLVRTGRPLFARKLVLATCLLIAAICVALTARVTSVYDAVLLVAVAVFFLYLTGSCYWAIIQDSVRREHVGGVSGFMHGTANCSGIIGPALTGLIVQQTGSFNGAFGLAGAISVLGVIAVILFVRPPAVAAAA